MTDLGHDKHVVLVGGTEELEVERVVDFWCLLDFDKATQSQAHRLSHAYDVLDSEPSCEHCQEFQSPQAEELVQDV